MNTQLMNTAFAPRRIEARSMTWKVGCLIGTFWLHNADELAHLDEGGTIETTLNETDMTVTIRRAGGQASFNCAAKTTKKALKQLVKTAMHELRNHFYA